MKLLFICLCAWATAQLAKFGIGVVREKRFNWSYFVSPGGMPSSHSATVSSLATGIGLIYSINSTYFAIAAIMALVVMYDAAGVRQSVSRQAVILNRIMRELQEQRPRGEVEKDLRELVGHTPFQVIVGAALGVSIAWLWVFLA